MMIEISEMNNELCLPRKKCPRKLHNQLDETLQFALITDYTKMVQIHGASVFIVSRYVSPLLRSLCTTHPK